MKGKFLRHKKDYYRQINHIMNRINLDLKLKSENNLLENNDDTLLYINNTHSPQLQSVKCNVCKINVPKYKCPKCSIYYCSINCYKKHNEKCTEEFYKNNIIEELKATKFSDEEIVKNKEKLKNYYEKLNDIDEKYESENSNEIQENEINHYEKILEKMEANTFNEKTDFTSDDWKNFDKFIKNIQDSIFKIYKPFWLREPKSILVIDKNYYESFNEEDINALKNLDLNNDIIEYFNENNENDENYNDDKFIKLKNENILIDENVINDSLIIRYINVNKLNFTKASHKNINQIVSVILLTVYIFRYFNGCFDSDIDNNECNNLYDVFKYMDYFCPLLFSKKIEDIPNNTKEAYNNFIEKLKIIEKNKMYLLKINKLLVYDIIILLKGGKFFIFESLIRIYDLIHKYSLLQNINKSEKNRCNAAKYKIIYLISYLKYEVTEKDIQDILESFSSIKNEIY